jgi:predicted kinase
VILLHLNGPPAVGKTTVAELVVDARPGATSLDIDGIRVSLPGWRDDPGTMQRARDIAYEAATQHLRSGHDVVIPQLDARVEVLLQLQQLARSCGATFVEVVLTAGRDELLRRFRSRTGEHPADAVDDVEATVDGYVAGIERVTAAWPTAIVVESTTPAETAARVLAALPTA